MKLRIALLILVLAVTGCQTQTVRGTHESHRPAPSPEPIANPIPGSSLGKPSEIPSPSETSSQPQIQLPDASALGSYPRDAEAISGTAVISLLKQASEARAAGQPDQAAAVLERALRIESRNYFVWSSLATSYLQRKNYDEAESAAQKSNSLARGNVYVEQENWRVIHAARMALGDADGAAQAQAHMDAIQQLLSQPR